MEKNEKGNLIAEGKTKKVWEAVIGADNKARLISNDKVIIENKKDITAFDDPEFTKQFATKATHATETTCRVFELLKKAGIPVAYERQISDTEFLAQKCKMIPLESVVRRFAVGSYLKRHPELAKKENENPYYFHRLLTEYFLKTTKGKLVSGSEILVDGLDPKKGEEDPLIINPQNELWELHHPKKPIWDKEVNLNRTIQANDVLPRLNFTSGEGACFNVMDSYLRKAFLVLEGMWKIMGLRLIDMKIEFGLTTERKIVISDVIDNDSWRLRDNDWKELSKESFRQGEELSEVEKKYGIVADLVKNFKFSKQALVFWTGSKSDKRPEIPAKLKDSHAFTPVYVTISGHKATRIFLNALDELMVNHPEGGVILAKIGMSNGAGPILAPHTSWPVISIPASLKEFPEDIWSNVRMPSDVPMLVTNTDQNAIDAALNILAQKNPIAYMHRQLRIEELDI
jgi:phosphoribosylaminoimidazole carboxylase/phosphoribosylaminoimidazole-succinocarboxamide synthase